MDRDPIRIGRLVGALARQNRWLAACALSFVAGCGGGGGSSGDSGPTLIPSADVPADETDAARFLTQATFGPSREDIAVLMAGGFTGWLDWQLAQPVSLERPALQSDKDDGDNVGQDDRMERWWLHAMLGRDQLRLRVAYALSQIFVISDLAGPLNGDPIGVAEYYDILARNALGSFRKLLRDVTLSPQMGRYLSMLKNRKADPAHNIRPDENYAREVMQLFTIGLYELEPNGDVRVDGNGAPIPTYTQATVETYARVYTGWNYAGATNWQWAQENYLPMEPWQEYHDTDPKTLIDGTVLPPNQMAEDDLDAALDSLFRHANVGPFIGRQLIQRLVTSNPTPEYVERVGHVFDDDGSGMRGNLFAVVKAVLLDDEARHGHEADPAHFGKLKEPILRQTALWRAFHAYSHNRSYRVHHPENDFGQAPLRAPSVFNFYSPFYQPPGDMLDAGLYGPEFQITTHTLITSGTNEFHSLVFWGNSSNHDADDDTVTLQIQSARQLAADPPALVDELDLLLMAGQMSDEMRQIVVDLVEDTDATDGGTRRVLEAIYMIVASPEGALQR